MAYKAFNWNVMTELDLRPEEVQGSFHAALFVFGIQLLMILFLASVMFCTDGRYTFDITLPPDLAVLGARFVCTILMHLQVESDVRQGLRMMKYLSNHRDDFMSANTAFLIALMQTSGGLAAELFCIIYLCSINSPVDVIIRFVALASIAKVDDFYASALPTGNRVKMDSQPLKNRNFRRLQSEKPQTISFYVGRFIYKSLRMFYCSFLFYFLPYLAVIIPYMTGAIKA